MRTDPRMTMGVMACALAAFWLSIAPARAAAMPTSHMSSTVITSICLLPGGCGR